MIAGMLLIPPWVRVVDKSGIIHVSELSGYYPVWSPPAHTETIWTKTIYYPRLGSRHCRWCAAGNSPPEESLTCSVVHDALGLVWKSV